MAQNGLLTQPQSTRPRGARRCGLSPSTTARWFQSTRPRGARHQSPNHPYKGLEFQSTRPRGARQLMMRLRNYIHQSFNPRAHVGRDAVDHYGDPESLVSIHAPTWGATLASVLVVVGRAVSIHAPTWGATVLLRWMLQLGYLFQSTRPRGARPIGILPMGGRR